MNPNAIDVSYAQTRVDWSRVKSSGVAYAVIKATQGGNLNGTVAPFEDPLFRTHAKNAHAVKLPTGFYHFLVASTVAEAVAQADYFLSAVRAYPASYLYLDCEVYNIKPMEALSRGALTDICVAFLDRCRAAGYIAALYTNPDHLQNRLDASRLQYPLWIAYYTANNPRLARQILWQYGIGTVSGVTGAVDLNLCSIPEEHLSVMRLAEKNFIVNPAYWIGRLPYVKYLDILLKQADAVFSYRWKQSTRVDWACQYLNSCGVMNSPDYWIALAETEPYLDVLLCNLGGGQI